MAAFTDNQKTKTIVQGVDACMPFFGFEQKWLGRGRIGLREWTAYSVGTGSALWSRRAKKSFRCEFL